MWHNYGLMGWGWVLGGLIVLSVLLVIAVVFIVVREAGSSHAEMPGLPPGPPRQAPGPPRQRSASAKAILDERYARGEMTTEEYQERIRVLGLDS